jgi:DNA-binding transcriptional LysR family regulator
MEGVLEISQLRYFLALCEQRSFTRAAEQCGVSQPSLSNAIMALEAELGGRLVQRSPFKLTALGDAVKPQFRSALRHIARAATIAQVQSRIRGAPSQTLPKFPHFNNSPSLGRRTNGLRSAVPHNRPEVA